MRRVPGPAAHHLAILAALAAPAAASVQEAPAKRHIVYLVVDDLGWEDVGFNGSIIRTPNLDRPAQQGARLQQF